MYVYVYTHITRIPRGFYRERVKVTRIFSDGFLFILLFPPHHYPLTLFPLKNSRLHFYVVGLRSTVTVNHGRVCMYTLFDDGNTYFWSSIIVIPPPQPI